jgi:hypothetical protein
MFASVAQLSPVEFSLVRDKRGTLVSFELDKAIPFKVARVFWVYDVPSNTSRGGHAHKECHQFLVCSCGVVSVEVSDGRERRMHVLKEGMALHIPPAIFASQRFDRSGSVLTVFCDQPYDRSEYIDDIVALEAFRSE